MNFLEIACMVLNILMGALLMYLLSLGWDRWRTKRLGTPHSNHPIRKYGAVIMVVMTFIGGSVLLGVQSYTTDQRVVALTSETRRCYVEFAERLAERSKLSLQNDALSREQRNALITNNNALLSFITNILTPPDDIARLPEDNPVRRQWGRDIFTQLQQTIQASNKILADSQAREIANDKERENTALPAPTCGQ